MSLHRTVSLAATPAQSGDPPPKRNRADGMELLESRLMRSTAVWTGLADDNWFTPGNWQAHQVPVMGQDVDFPENFPVGYPASHASNVVFGSDVTVGNVTFEGDYRLEGAIITLDGSVSATDYVNDEIDSPVLARNTTISVTQGAQLTLMDLTDDGRDFGITEVADGLNARVLLSGSKTSYTGATVVAEGTLNLASILASSVRVDAGADLTGTGKANGILAEAADPSGQHPAAVGSYSQGPGLTSSNGLVLGTGSILYAGFPFNSGGLPTGTPGDFSGLSVTAGAIGLAGSTLSVSQAPADISAGTVLTLISNSTGHPVSGTFAGLPDGSIEDGYRINYGGGANHQEVTLTVTPPVTIAAPAHASPNIVVGDSTLLTALGSTSPAAGLTYHWAVVASPPGAPKPRFSTNGSAAARRSVVTFGKAGYYRLRCTISDGSDDSAASDVSVRVEQTATRLRLRPLHATVAKGRSIAITSTELDQFGDPLADQGTPAFSILSGPGTANATTGQYTATAFGTVLIEAEEDKLTGDLGLEAIGS